MKVSIIIPVLDEEATIGKLLSLLQESRVQGHEVIVVDGGSSDNTLAIARQYADLCLPSVPGRARQMNVGAAHASGEVLLFMHADSVLPQGAITDIGNAITNKADWGFFRVAIADDSLLLRMVSRFMTLRSRLTAIATGDQCLFVRRELFDRLAGFADIPIMEDIELTARLKTVCRPVCLDGKVTTSARRWRKHGTIKTILSMWRYRFLFWCGVSTNRLADYYYPGRTRRSDYAVFVFARPVVKGQVKTRLASMLSKDERSELHTALCESSIELACASGLQVELWTPDTTDTVMRSLAADHAIPLRLQQGQDLGERMCNAVIDGLQRYKGVILIGTDCPVLQVSYLQQAASMLEHGRNDIVFGPAEDGGYVLLATRRLCKAIFEHIPWGTEQVYRQSIDRLHAAAISYTSLETLWDIDRPEDVLRYRQLAMNGHPRQATVTSA